MKLTNVDAVVHSFCSSFDKTLTIRASLCKQQYVISMDGFSRFTKAVNPLPSPTIAEAPSVQPSMQSLQLISWAIKNSLFTPKISWPLVRFGSSLQNRRFCFKKNVKKRTTHTSCAFL